MYGSAVSAGISRQERNSLCMSEFVCHVSGKTGTLPPEWGALNETLKELDVGFNNLTGM
jgi:hypothetical protein